MLFFADRAERAVTQTLLMGAVVAVITTKLLLINSLDNPFHDSVGGLRPVAMERTITIMDEAMQVTGFDGPLPCDDRGNKI